LRFQSINVCGDWIEEKEEKKDVQVKAVQPKRVTVPQIKVQNIVVSADLHAVIDLYALSKEVKAVDYEPEQFPGAIFRVTEPKSKIILFKNGKLICTGTNTEANIRRVLDYVAKVVSKYVIELNPTVEKPKEIPKEKPKV
jgi:TATA-box binding protein (TBP) (component of TFIID and TFIIIB)